jgi:hypothetical protein
VVLEVVTAIVVTQPNREINGFVPSDTGLSPLIWGKFLDIQLPNRSLNLAKTLDFRA